MTDPNNIAIDSEANLPSAAHALQQGSQRGQIDFLCKSAIIISKEQ